ncbi:hypothetical protein CTI12_AA242770 [Artemisia annua]|uniref:NADH:quinone oxidoreductase/Mrp antiporter transmembrane domain-containing protein n=1 Tax=Artemisia annua TaxID=35608 RepID=A0A2U1NPK9_ARTAN|nr:hypothetical protein CTI12_AA242770 [Artemisia annua]
MYLAIEPQSLCFYVIATSKRKSEFSTEAGSKYLILGAFSSGILLFGDISALISDHRGRASVEQPSPSLPPMTKGYFNLENSRKLERVAFGSELRSSIGGQDCGPAEKQKSSVSSDT